MVVFYQYWDYVEKCEILYELVIDDFGMLFMDVVGQLVMCVVEFFCVVKDKLCVELILFENVWFDLGVNWMDVVGMLLYLICKVFMYVDLVQQMMQQIDYKMGWLKWREYSQVEIWQVMVDYDIMCQQCEDKW